MDNIKKTMAVVEEHKLKLSNEEQRLLIDFTIYQKPCIPEMFPGVLYGYTKKEQQTKENVSQVQEKCI